MLVYVDESGDPGLKGKRGTSAKFVVAAVSFDDEDAARSCRRAIRRLHTTLGWAERQEFKFNKSDHEVRDRFFEVIRLELFRYEAVVIEKEKLAGRSELLTEQLYHVSLRLLFEGMRLSARETTVVVDQSGGRDFRTGLRQCLRTGVPQEVAHAIKRVRTEKSHACELVQMADMVVGAVARSFGDRRDATMYRDRIAARERRVCVWPA